MLQPHRGTWAGTAVRGAAHVVVGRKFACLTVICRTAEHRSLGPPCLHGMTAGSKSLPALRFPNPKASAVVKRLGTSG